MKRFVPLKYVLGMGVLFLIVPLLGLSWIVYNAELNDVTITICFFLVGLIICGPVAYFQNQENASIVFEKGQIINYINDGTLNFGWAEEIKKIKRIEICNNDKVKEIFKNCKSKKVMLIDFGSYNIKYISVSLFTNNQINQIIKYIKANK
ncbi:MAG: hypothetical protein IKD02_06425 [Clostridia bacterium]|nr:hypothetical protein [Clostridia bacterium]